MPSPLASLETFVWTILLIVQQVGFQPQLSQQVKHSLLQITLACVLHDFLAQYFSHLLRNFIESFLQICWQHITHCLSNLVLQPQRYILFDPVFHGNLLVLKSSLLQLKFLQLLWYLIKRLFTILNAYLKLLNVLNVFHCTLECFIHQQLLLVHHLPLIIQVL